MIIRKEEKILLLWMVQSMSCKLPLVPKATYTILGFNVLIYLLQMASMAILNEDDLLLMLGTRVITPVFIHGSVTHIFFNMYALLSTGSFL